MIVKILITGADSYIGTSVEKWLLQYGDAYCIDTLDMKNSNWEQTSFSGYDVVFHVAGIAHVSTDPNMKEQYYLVNRDLTIKTAKKAKLDGVKQFIFMSSIIVYGNSGRIGQEKIITPSTKENPADFYGESKLMAEQGILPLCDDSFHIVIVRPPMIYGKDSKGNYRKLSRFAKKLPFFPNIPNTRSMLHIDNLCEFIRLSIDNQLSGTYYPQNKEYVSTSNMVKAIAAVSHKKLHLTKIFNPALYVMGYFIGTVNKVFGNMAYTKEMSEYDGLSYRVVDFEESIKRTEGLQ